MKLARFLFSAVAIVGVLLVSDTGNPYALARDLGNTPTFRRKSAIGTPMLSSRMPPNSGFIGRSAANTLMS